MMHLIADDQRLTCLSAVRNSGPIQTSNPPLTPQLLLTAPSVVAIAASPSLQRSAEHRTNKVRS